MKDRLLAVPVIGTALRMQARYTADSADALAAAIGFFGFLSLFPLVAIAVAIVGFVLEGDVAAQARVARTIEQSIPALSALAGDGSSLRTAISGASENAPDLLGIGALLALISGMRVAGGAQTASAVVFRVERPSGVRAKAEQLVALGVVGLLALAGAGFGGTAGVNLASADVVELGRSLVLIAIALAFDVALFLVAYRMFTPGDGPAWRVLLPGSVLAGSGWLALKLFGTGYITSQATKADGQYGALGGVIGLLLLFYLGGRLYLYGAELAALLANVDDDDSDAMAARAEDDAGDERPAPIRQATVPTQDVLPSVGEVVRLGALATGAGALGAVLARAAARRGGG